MSTQQTSRRPGSIRLRYSCRKSRRLMFESLEARAVLAGDVFDQTHPSVGIDRATGATVAVWQSIDETSPGLGSAVCVEVNGGSTYEIATDPSDHPMNPSVSMNDHGDFVVVWQAYDQADSSRAYDVYGEYFTASNGTPSLGNGQMSPSTVNTTTAASQYDPAVALDDGGTFAVTWLSEGQGPTQLGSNGGLTTGPGGVGLSGGGGGGGAGGAGAMAIRPASAKPSFVRATQGVMVMEFQGSSFTKNPASEVVANTCQSSPEGFIGAPSIGIDNSGNSAVTFVAEDAGGVFNGVQYDNYYAYARRFSSTESPLDPVQVMFNTSPGDGSSNSSIAVNATGSIVLAWAGSQASAMNLDQGIFTQSWSMTQSALPGAEVAYSAQNTVADKTMADVSINDSGSYVVAYQYADEPNGGSDVYVGSTLIGTSPASDTTPVVALSDSGSMIDAWVDTDPVTHQKTVVHNP